MDVRCGRCGTEYEFDDALISERGTTVKCTNCGYQFKVFPPQSSHGVPERWVVRTASGHELVFTSLRDLQRGIAQRQVGPEDLLSRGNQPPRALASIAELEPFFQMRAAVHVPRQPRTLHGVAPPANAPPADGTARNQTPAGIAPPKPARSPPIGAGIGAAAAAADQEPPTIPRNLTPAVEAARAAAQSASQSARTEPAAPPAQSQLGGFAPVAAAPAAPWPTSADEASAPLTPTPSGVRENMASYDDFQADSRFLSAGPPSRRARSRFIVALVLVGVFVLAAATVGRRYLANVSQKSKDPAPAASTDARVAQMLENAQRLATDGDFEGAKEQLDKASVLADKDQTVLVALAELETMRADLLWLELRLLDPADEPLVRSTHQRLGRRVGKAREAVDAATRVADGAGAVLRARIDTLRLEEKLADARALVGPVSQNPSQPDNAYTLAALDLAEAAPGWSSIIERLRNAAAAERGAGRARAALVYALARSGALADAESELEKLRSRPKPHPLLAELESFMSRHRAVADAGVAAAGEAATLDVTKLPKLDTRAAAGDGEERVAVAGGGDFRAKLTQASAALQRGDLAGADRLYRAVLAEQPNNTEAMSGLAEVARRRNDPETARRMNERVLEQNPSYLPALIAAADSRWQAGDRSGAVTLYRRVLDQAGPGSEYGQRAAARIAQAESAASKEPSASPSPPPPAEEKPPIDTTDLPEQNE